VGADNAGCPRPEALVAVRIPPAVRTRRLLNLPTEASITSGGQTEPVCTTGNVGIGATRLLGGKAASGVMSHAAALVLLPLLRLRPWQMPEHQLVMLPRHFPPTSTQPKA